ncbi:uncharacterized protein PV09_07599 [Verruconis gallopava]|uniref:Uncharacterized protein n=1 Tax=Verruconis gallopava TaxID=253628 RepID=A0A0D2ANZ4_9PEZI|nr:uncharacterized protein PV09_07599 [Verruconis gallopava]KIW00839.1 hypothetical protein PV09_07599 [Verruconis gallopava]
MPDLKRASAKRPKLVQRASQYLVANYGKAKEPNYFTDVEPRQDVRHHVSLEQAIDSLHSGLMRDTFKPLGAEQNSAVLRVLEGYMRLKAENGLLLVKMEALSRQHDENVDTLEDERRMWKEEEEMYRAEVKRLEIMIAEGKTGLGQVTLARQQSLVRRKDNGRERWSSEKGRVSAEWRGRKSPGGSIERPKFEIIRPTTPSDEMKQLSKSIKANHSFLSLNCLPERPPSRMRGLSLADVDIPRHWRKKSEVTSAAPSTSGSPAKISLSDDDFSSTGGDALQDEIDQQELDKQAIHRVAKLMAANAPGVNLGEAIRLLEACIAGHLDLTVLQHRSLRNRRPSTPLSERSSEDGLTIRSSKSLTVRHGADQVCTNTENEPSLGRVRRPFSFYAGDDQMSTTDVRCVAENPSSHSSISPEASPKRHGSLLASLGPERITARPRREDSSSSVLTSFRRSPVGDGGNLGSEYGSASSLTRASCLLGDLVNDRSPAILRRASSLARMKSTGFGR